MAVKESMMIDRYERYMQPLLCQGEGNRKPVLGVSRGYLNILGTVAVGELKDTIKTQQSCGHGRLARGAAFRDVDWTNSAPSCDSPCVADIVE